MRHSITEHQRSARGMETPRNHVWNRSRSRKDVNTEYTIPDCFTLILIAFAVAGASHAQERSVRFDSLRGRCFTYLIVLARTLAVIQTLCTFNIIRILHTKKHINIHKNIKFIFDGLCSAHRLLHQLFAMLPAFFVHAHTHSSFRAQSYKTENICINKNKPNSQVIIIKYITAFYNNHKFILYIHIYYEYIF